MAPEPIQRFHHESYVQYLPNNIDVAPTSLSFFRLFFPDHVLDTIVNNTNIYAESKGAVDDDKRPWHALTRQDLLRFLSILIYRGIFPSAQLKDYWAMDHRFPVHKITSLMTQTRFEQIKRYLHISDHTAPHVHYYDKVQPLLNHVQATSQRHYVPKTSVSVDEMIVRFGGRSQHTYRLKGKPTPVGYKILALCDSGYTYAFLPESRVSQASDLPPDTPSDNDDRLSMTGRKVMFLVEQLPFDRHVFNIYMDNYFSTIPLFKNLRNRQIGACGTCRPHTPMFPDALKGFKDVKMDWDEKGAVIVNNVLVLLWMDNGPVTMLSTIHSLHTPDWFIERERRKPRTTSTNAAKVRRVFGDAHRKLLPIPCMINDYNQHMGGVDIADQLRQYYTTQMRTFRNWFPLFLWLLDTAIINAYIMRTVHLKRKNMKGSHREFRLCLVEQLQHHVFFEEAQLESITTRSGSKRLRQDSSSQQQNQQSDQPDQSNRSTSYLTKHKQTLSADRFAPGRHPPGFIEKDRNCVWCALQDKKQGITPRRKRSSVVCLQCNVSLCLRPDANCFDLYHTQIEP